MDLRAKLALGVETACSPTDLLDRFIGVTLGTCIGVRPGIGALATNSMLLPLTFHDPATTALAMLAGIDDGASQGGSTACILRNLPGRPSAAVACRDGCPMAKMGRPGVARFMTTIASFVGGSLGLIILTLFSPKLAAVGLAFGLAECFAMMPLGLIAAATPTQGSPVKGILMVLLAGTGGTSTSAMAYAGETRVAKEPERFGQDAVEGVAAPESRTPRRRRPPSSPR